MERRYRDFANIRRALKAAAVLEMNYVVTALGLWKGPNGGHFQGAEGVVVSTRGEFVSLNGIKLRPCERPFFRVVFTEEG